VHYHQRLLYHHQSSKLPCINIKAPSPKPASSSSN
jgi:hypothetical protein